MLGPGPRLIKKEFTGPRSHKGWETLAYGTGYLVRYGRCSIYRTKVKFTSPLYCSMTV